MTSSAMRKLLSVAAAVLLLASLSASTCAQQPGNKPAPVTGSVSGRVSYSDSKAPARLAQVMLMKVAPAGTKAQDDAANPLQSFLSGCALKCISTTGLDGAFFLSEIPAGRYLVLAMQAGSVNPLARMDLDVLNKMSTKQIGEDQIKDYLNYLTVVTVEPGKTVDAVVNLTHGGSVSGVLTYDDGSAAVGIKVKLLVKTRSGSFEEPNMMMLGGVSSNSTLLGYITDDAGRYHIPGLVAGVYAVKATVPVNALKNLTKNIKGALALGMSSPGSMGSAMAAEDGLSIYSGNVFFKKDLKPIGLGENKQLGGIDMSIPVGGMYSVGVRVTDAVSGSPVQVAQVELLDADGKEALRAGFVDDNGECTFDYVPDGIYTLRTINAMDVSQVGKMLSDNYDPKKAIHYAAAETKLRVSKDVSGIVLQVSRPKDQTKAGQ